jgi:MoaA/NifB/PqqE/SkfB family radical SAM enzyme
MTHSKANSSKSYCVLPFIQQFVDTDKRILPCCIADRRRIGPEYKGTDSFNSDYLKKIRKQMLNGIRSPACRPCWDKEIVGFRSKRKKVNEQFSDWSFEVEDDGTMITVPQYYDLRPGNVCNLKCVMCNPRVSSKWREDKEYSFEQFDKTVKFHDDEMDDIVNNASSIKRIQLAGGEPFYMPSVTRLLNKLKPYASNIELHITTNLTVLNDDMLQLLEQFKKSVITISIDGLGVVGEYIRFPLNWEVFETNFNKLLTYKKLKLSVNITKSVLNAPHVDSVVEWCKNYGIKDIEINDLTEPSVLATGSDREHLTEWLSRLDKHRGTNSRLVLPWIYE